MTNVPVAWKRIALIALVCSTVGCDRVTKHLAAENLELVPQRSFLSDTVRLVYVENEGAFLALGAEWHPHVRVAIFTYGGGLLMLGVLITAVRLRWTGLAAVGTCLYLAGAVSNLADRIMRGSVIDFLNVGLGPIRTGIFNVADVAIMLGVSLIIVGLYREERGGEHGYTVPTLDR
jgi:signal peptidase II